MVDPCGTGHRRLVPLRWDYWAAAKVPDVLTEGTTSGTAIGHHPTWHPWQTSEWPDSLGQFMSLSWGETESDGTAAAAWDHAGVGAIAATRSPKCLTRSAPGSAAPFRAAPAAFWCARMSLPSKKVLPNCTPRSCAIVSSRSHTPSLPHRIKVCAAVHQGPSSARRLLHFPSFW
jgi:hypothetical protein